MEVLPLPLWPECCLLGTHVLGTALHIVLTVMHMAFILIKQTGKHVWISHLWEHSMWLMSHHLCKKYFVQASLDFDSCEFCHRKNINLLKSILNFACKLKYVFVKTASNLVMHNIIGTSLHISAPKDAPATRYQPLPIQFSYFTQWMCKFIKALHVCICQ